MKTLLQLIREIRGNALWDFIKWIFPFIGSVLFTMLYSFWQWYYNLPPDLLILITIFLLSLTVLGILIFFTKRKPLNQAEVLPPNLKVFSIEKTGVSFNVSSKSWTENNAIWRGLFIKFENETVDGKKVSNVERLNANIDFYNENDERVYSTDEGAWIDIYASAYLEAGRRIKLLILGQDLDNPDWIIAIGQNNKRESLRGKFFIVKVKLVDEKQRIYNFNFEFILDEESKMSLKKLGEYNVLVP